MFKEASTKYVDVVTGIVLGGGGNPWKSHIIQN